MRVVLPITDVTTLQSAENVYPRLEICVPERIRSIGKGLRKIIDIGIESLLCKYLHEGKIHINVIIETWTVVEIMLDAAFVPNDFLAIRNHLAFPFELGRSAIGTAYGLACPTSLDLVKKSLL